MEVRSRRTARLHTLAPEVASPSLLLSRPELLPKKVPTLRFIPGGGGGECLSAH